MQTAKRALHLAGGLEIMFVVNQTVVLIVERFDRLEGANGPQQPMERIVLAPLEMNVGRRNHRRPQFARQIIEPPARSAMTPGQNEFGEHIAPPGEQSKQRQRVGENPDVILGQCEKRVEQCAVELRPGRETNVRSGGER